MTASIHSGCIVNKLSLFFSLLKAHRYGTYVSMTPLTWSVEDEVVERRERREMSGLVVVICCLLAAILPVWALRSAPAVALRTNWANKISISKNYPSITGVHSIQARDRTELKDLLGLGPAEIAITLVVALVLFGPETLKSLSKDVGRAAAELKEIPKTFKEGMDEGAESAQIAKMKAIAAEKRKKRDEKVGGDDENPTNDE